MALAEDLDTMKKILEGVEKKNPGADRALMNENAEYRARILRMRPVIEASRELDVALAMWAGQGFPPKGPLCASVVTISKKVHQALVACGGDQ